MTFVIQHYFLPTFVLATVLIAWQPGWQELSRLTAVVAQLNADPRPMRGSVSGFPRQ